MRLLRHPPIEHYANLFQVGEHHIVTELQGLKIEQERGTYADVVRCHPLKCMIEPPKGEIITFPAYRVCSTTPGKFEGDQPDALWSQRVASVLKATGSKSILISQGKATNPHLPKGVRGTMLNAFSRQKLKFSQARVVIYDIDWADMYTGYLLTMHDPKEDPWV